MRDRIIKKMMTLTLAFAMVFTMMPLAGIGVQEASASSANGGDVFSDYTSNQVKEVLGDTVTVSAGSTNLAITLQSDIELSDTLNLYRAVSGVDGNRTITINLNNHTITGPDGKDAIKVVTMPYFYVEIAGSGSVIGGKGIIKTNDGVSYGGNGGYGIRITQGSSEYTENDTLKCAITLKSGAVVKGGEGASISYSDIVSGLDSDGYGGYAGNGGCGIGSDESDGANYIKYVVESGSIMGGEGGNVEINDNVITRYEMMKFDAVKSWYSSNYKDVIPVLTPGDGGDGINFRSGRAYFNIAKNTDVTGGEGGAVIYGDTGILAASSNAASVGDGGMGIDVYGDIGLGRLNPDYSVANWPTAYSSITSENEYMGMYIAGTVSGGNTKSTIADDTGYPDPGDGIYLHLDSDYKGYDTTLGIIEIDTDGVVKGGNGGDSLRGSSFAGDGIVEKGNGTGVVANAKYYIINGTVQGGNGGNSWTPRELEKDYSQANGGDGIYMPNIQADDAINENGIRNLAGSGYIKGGSSGSLLAVSGAGNQQSGAEALNTGMSGYRDEVIKISGDISGHMSSGADATIISNADYSKDLSAQISINNTALNCNVSPNYSGKKFYYWTVTTYDSIGGKNHTWDIESSGTDYSKFSIMRNSDYDNLLKVGYDPEVATVERIAEDIQYNNMKAEIYCRVIFEDGRFVDASPITLPAKWSGTGSYSGEGGSGGGGSGGDSGDDQAAIDQAAADSVMGMIEALPSLSSITLDDEADITAARAAYDALTDSQKALLAPYPYLLDDLEAAEARIKELKGNSDKVQAVLDLIGELAAAEDITEDNAQDEAEKITAIRNAISELTSEQQQLLAEETDALAKFAATELAVNKALADDPDSVGHTHLMCYVEAKAATCTNAGNKEYYFCMTCDDGNLYADAEGTEVLTEDDVIIARDDYAHVMTKVDAHAATCKAAGNKAYYRCAECGRLFEDADGTIEYTSIDSVIIPVDANAHVWKNGSNKTTFGIDSYTIKRTDTCTLCGATRLGVNKTVAYKKSLPKVKIAKGKAGKKKLTAKWKKVTAKNKKKIGGIEIQVYGPGLNKVYTAGKGKTSKVIKGLKAKKKYKYRVRAYKGSGTSKQVSKWSGWKTVKVK